MVPRIGVGMEDGRRRIVETFSNTLKKDMDKWVDNVGKGPFGLTGVIEKGLHDSSEDYDELSGTMTLKATD